MSTRPVPPARRSGSSAVERFFTNMHVALYRLSGGMIGGGAGGRSFLILTTRGRRSGKEYSRPLVYIRDNGRFVVIASNYGKPRHPAWWLNLQAEPHAKVQIGRQVIPVTARAADPEERTRLWSTITERYRNFAEYQQQTTREIPVVILTPENR